MNRKTILKFEVKISKENGEFLVDVDMEDGTILKGYGKNIFEIYESISKLLIDWEEEDKEDLK